MAQTMKRLPHSMFSPGLLPGVLASSDMLGDQLTELKLSREMANDVRFGNIYWRNVKQKKTFDS